MERIATYVPVTGEPVDVQPKNGTDFSLEELQQFVGGYIEIASVCDCPEKIVVCNENGLLEGLECNVIASILSGGYIVGDVLVCDSDLVK